jgi:arsenite methyltransferase
VTEESRESDQVRAAVRSRYAAVALRDGSVSLPVVSELCCGTTGSECCSGGCAPGSDYSREEIASLPEGAHLGLGCGNPAGLAELRAGEKVLDLGSGAGVDCFLAGGRVGASGYVIGVDMTAEMVAKARENARTSGRTNVEFRLGEIEHLPVADASIDVVLSNCVINLAVDKEQVYREAFRVLRPGGRIVVADVLATRPIPPEIRGDLERWASCSSGALSVSETEEVLRKAGFSPVSVTISAVASPKESLEGQGEIGVFPGTVRASKPSQK